MAVISRVEKKQIPPKEEVYDLDPWLIRKDTNPTIFLSMNFWIKLFKLDRQVEGEGLSHPFDL